MALALILAAGACLRVPDVDTAADPLVVTEITPTGARETVFSPQAAAVAEMRAKAAAAESAGYAPVFDASRTARLAAREEPRPVSEAEAIQSELAALAVRRQGTTNAGEVAAMEARAAELRRLGAEAEAASLRR